MDNLIHSIPGVVAGPIGLLISWGITLLAGLVVGRFLWAWLIKPHLIKKDKAEVNHSVSKAIDCAWKDSISIQADAQTIFDQLIGGSR